MMVVIRHVAFLSPRLFVPASLATVIFGLINAFTTWGFGLLWIWLGLVGFAATFTTGNFFLRPRAEQLAQLDAVRDHDKAVVLSTEILTLAKFDYTMLFVVVANMVFKPQLSSWFVLLVMVAVLVAAGYFFLLPVLGKPAPKTT